MTRTDARPPQRSPLLRFVTCGSVDDGKSTLIGRLLYDAGLVADDHLATLVNDSRGRPCGPEGLDFSLLVDGLAAEREQGITIDVAHRYFGTARRSFIVYDAPGHEQHTRNMATAASNASAAIVLVDARKGILRQTRRHTAILSLMGIRRVALVVNKMDLVGFDQAVFAAIADSFEPLARRLEIEDVAAIPVAAINGANVVEPSELLFWHRGPTLLQWLETVPVEDGVSAEPFRMPVQWVNRAGMDFRGVSGRVAAGRIGTGDRVEISASRQQGTVTRIITMDGDLTSAEAGRSVTLVLEQDLDIARGDVLFTPHACPAVTDQFAANLLWLADESMLPHRSYGLRIGTALVTAEVTVLKHRVDVDTMEKSPAQVLRGNEIGFCNFALSRPVALDPYAENRRTGSFVLIDRESRATVGAGMVQFALQRAANVQWQNYDVTRERRSLNKGQTPAILWFTGLSGSGKSTLANLIDWRLTAAGRHTFVLDGDNVRLGLCKDLGFTQADRVENIRRTAEVARLLADAGLIVLVCLISPTRRERQAAREIAADIEFAEVFVDAPLEVCEKRDSKGLYARARAGKIKNFTGVSSLYERPDHPDLWLRNHEIEPEVCAERVLSWIDRRQQR